MAEKSMPALPRIDFEAPAEAFEIIRAYAQQYAEQRVAEEREADRKAMQQAVEAIAGAIEWDCARDFPVPYRVRDPLRAALASLRERQGESS